MSDLKSRFTSLFPDELASIAGQCFKELEGYYSETHRHYHTLKHIESCLAHLDSITLKELKRNLELAIWFHDVIYNPKKKDNEAKSAEFAALWLAKLSEPSDVISTVKHYIDLTVHPSEPNTVEEKYLIDIDLSILGASPELFLEYESWIRQEYSFAPSVLYKRGRIQVLKGFLAQSSIYQTDEFKSRFEKQARLNLQFTIEQLGS